MRASTLLSWVALWALAFVRTIMHVNTERDAPEHTINLKGAN
jgi:hypothetical protein